VVVTGGNTGGFGDAATAGFDGPEWRDDLQQQRRQPANL